MAPYLYWKTNPATYQIFVQALATIALNGNLTSPGGYPFVILRDATQQFRGIRRGAQQDRFLQETAAITLNKPFV